MDILYVENHAIFAESVSRQFLSQHKVTVVPSISSARSLLAQERFDVLLVDYDLDDGKGDELIGWLRGIGNTVPVVGVSSHIDGNTALVRAGAAAVCSKMDFENIQNIIDMATRKTK